MPDDLYHRDFVTWSTEQADKLRRLSQGEQVNDIDWPHVIEEVGDLGRTEATQVRSLLLRAMEHMLKVVAYPAAADPRGWLHEANTSLRDARLVWSPGMDQLLDLPELHDAACDAVRQLEYREGPPGNLPTACPWVVRDLLPKEKGRFARAGVLLEKLLP